MVGMLLGRRRAGCVGWGSCAVAAAGPLLLARSWAVAPTWSGKCWLLVGSGAVAPCRAAKGRLLVWSWAVGSCWGTVCWLLGLLVADAEVEAGVVHWW